MSDPDQREEAVFEAAMQRQGAERAAYLDQACAGDPALRERIEGLLGALDRAGGLLSQPAVPRDPAAPTITLPPTEKAGDTIGRYKLLQQIGEGGCGVVYMAEQEEPVRRRVALKVIKLGMDTKQVIARFEAERQALALMDHPNIAKVLDAGATDTGRPYFVMELVRGVKITEYCDENKLSTQDRLKLFIQVCQAIQHAHQKGIIHRDIKPSNILVTVNDGVPLPKVIDFGIAKATTGQPLTDKTLFTAFEQFIGTPAYMSPEQAVMTSLDVDTRSDIYSLGVLLYELLTGKTPFGTKELLQAGLEEMRRTIREKEPAKPSTRLSTMVEGELTTTAKRRQTDAPKLLHQVRGDLDWIVMKCLEKDRARRYETTNGLARDVERHLNNQPVVARPPSKLYEFRQTVRRHKFGFAAGGGLILVLAAGVLASTWQAIRATRAESAQSRLLSQAQTEAAKATAISDFLQQMLGAANPDAAKGADYSVRRMLDDFSAGLANQLDGQPEVEAAVRGTIGRAYYRLGDARKAQAHLERALTLRRRLFGDQAEPVAEILVDCAWTCYEQGHYTKGEAYVREGLDIYRKRGTPGRPVVYALWALQKLLWAQVRVAELEAVTQEALTIAGRSPGIEFPELASMIHGLAEAKNGESRHAEAETLALKGVEMNRRLRGPEHPETAWGLISLGVALKGQKRLPEAGVAFREALRIFRKHFSPGDRTVGGAMTELRSVLEAQGDSAAIEALCREILAEQRSTLGNDSPAVAETLGSLAANLQSQGKQAAAEKALREALDIIPKLDGRDLEKLPPIVGQLASLLRAQGKSQEAERLYEQTIQEARRTLGESHRALGQMLHDFGDFLFFQQSKFDAAAEQYLKALPIRRADHPEGTAWTLRNLGLAMHRAARPKEAELYLREVVALYRKLHQQESVFLTAQPLERLADALYQQHKLPEAEQTCREALVAYSKTEGIGGTGYARVTQTLVRWLQSENKLAEIETLLNEVLSQQRAVLGETNASALATLLELSNFLESQNRPTEAASRWREATETISKLRVEGANATALNDLAWRLVTAEIPTRWNIALAVELAQKALAATQRTNHMILDTLAAACAATGQFTNAIRFEQEAIAVVQDERQKMDYTLRLKLYKSNLPYRDHGWLAKRASALLTEGKPAEAEPLVRQCLAIRETIIPDDWRTFDARSMLGGCLMGQKKFTEAEPLLISGHEGMKQRESTIPLPGKPCLQEALQRLVTLYEETGGAVLAAEWRQKLAEFETAQRLTQLGIPRREARDLPNLIDLSAFYNAGFEGNWHNDRYTNNDLAELPVGIQVLAGTQFAVRGLIQLRGVNPFTGRFPGQVSSLPTAQKCRRVHFLHGAVCVGDPIGTVIGKYVFHYIDGTTQERPIVLGKDVLDWWVKPPDSAAKDGLNVAWAGQNGRSSPQGLIIRLYQTTWENPNPEAQITSIDFVSTECRSAPFLIAITVE